MKVDPTNPAVILNESGEKVAAMFPPPDKAASLAVGGEAVDVLADLYPRVQNFEDEGPYGEGWQSTALQAVLERARAVLEKAGRL